MLLGQVLDHIGDVVTGSGEPLLRSGFGLPAGLVDREVRHIPTGDEVPQRRYARVIGELPERVDGDQVWRVQWNLNSGVSLIRPLSTDGAPLTLSIIEEAERLAVLAPPPLQRLLDHHRRRPALI